MTTIQNMMRPLTRVLTIPFKGRPRAQKLKGQHRLDSLDTYNKPTSGTVQAVLGERKALHANIDRASRLGHVGAGLIFRLLDNHRQRLYQDRREADHAEFAVNAAVRRLDCMFPVAVPDAILFRAQTGREALFAALQPIDKAIVAICFMLVLILGAVGVEAFTLTIALRTQFQALSTGYDLGASLMPLRYGVIAALIFGHVLLHDHDDQGGFARGLLRRWRVIPIIAVIAGLALFMFTTTSSATGGDDGKVNISGIALGVVCAALFSISFLACNRLIGLLLPNLHLVFTGVAQRLKLAQVDRLLTTVDEGRASIKTLRREIGEREMPGALELKTATEAAAIVDQVAAEAHDHHASAEAIKDIELRPDDIVPASDTPLDALDKRQAYLKSLTVDHFLNILNQKEA